MEVKRTYTIQENGQVTLPTEWREKYGLHKGDEVIFEETDQGLLVNPRKAILARLLNEMSEELQAKGITLEELMQDGRAIRAQLLKEKYGIDVSPDDE
jgi:AbrB family looped-hinge helix DNA binding protein